eukprot:GHVS01078958.1.p1 GENE.GHVS01078958.1~~GHVS01078958.1.p1  ORF type:complete len:252 (-),score=101.65 GHVS01078958.1:608-1273(-)
MSPLVEPPFGSTGPPSSFSEHPPLCFASVKGGGGGSLYSFSNPIFSSVLGEDGRQQHRQNHFLFADDHRDDGDSRDGEHRDCSRDRRDCGRGHRDFPFRDINAAPPPSSWLLSSSSRHDSPPPPPSLYVQPSPSFSFHRPPPPASIEEEVDKTDFLSSNSYYRQSSSSYHHPPLTAPSATTTTAAPPPPCHRTRLLTPFPSAIKPLPSPSSCCSGPIPPRI